MRNKWVLRIWMARLLRYLAIPVAFCVILLPLYNLFRQQTQKTQLADTAENLTAAVNTFEANMQSLRTTTYRLFNDDSFLRLASASSSKTPGYESNISYAATALDNAIYNTPYAAYGFAAFVNNDSIVAPQRFFAARSDFYAHALEYEGIDQLTWEGWLNTQRPLFLPAQSIVLNRSLFPASYLTVVMPYTSGGLMRGVLVVLYDEETLTSQFLPTGRAREHGLFYLAQDDGTLLCAHNCEDAPLYSGSAMEARNYRGEEYLFVSRPVQSIGGSAVIGLPADLYAENVKVVYRAIWFYIGAGLFVCLLMSIAMTVWDVYQVRPILDSLADMEVGDERMLHRIIHRWMEHHEQLTAELSNIRSEYERSRLDSLFRAGTLGSAAERKELCARLHLAKHNYLLLIPAAVGDGDGRPPDDLYRLMLTDFVSQCYGRPYFVYHAADGSTAVVLSLEDDSPDALRTLCRQTEQLHTQLAAGVTFVLSGQFTEIEQLSAVYWQVRNLSAYADDSQKVCYLTDPSQQHLLSTDITSLERLSEYLLAGEGLAAVGLLDEFFRKDDLSPENFQQAFFSIRGVLLSVAKKVACEDIAPLCTYSSRASVKEQIRDLKDCCAEICAHVEAIKRSHNEDLQRKLLAYLNEQYARPDLNVAMTADHFNISKKYVTQFLKDHTGKSFTEYLEGVRLNQAMKLLRESDAGVTEIAVRCGFTTQNTFYKAFRRRFGISPTAARRSSAHME